MKFYKRDPDRALAGMAELSLQERGAYNTILDALYSRDGLLRDDDEMLRRIMGCHGNEWRKVKANLIAAGKIWSEDGYIKAKGVDSTIKEAEKVSETQKKNVEKRWENENKQAGKIEKNQQKQRSADTIQRDREILPPDVPTEHLPPKGGTSRKRATRLPDDWKPDERMVAYARSKGLTDDEIARCGDDIRDWSRSSPNGAKLDWNAAWQNWVRRFADERGKSRQAVADRRGDSPILAAARRGLARGGWDDDGPGEPSGGVGDGRPGFDGGAGNSGGDEPSSEPAKASPRNDETAAGDEGTGSDGGRSGVGERSDYRSPAGVAGGRGGGESQGSFAVIDVHPESGGNSPMLPGERAMAAEPQTRAGAADEIDLTISDCLRRRA